MAELDLWVKRPATLLFLQLKGASMAIFLSVLGLCAALAFDGGSSSDFGQLKVIAGEWKSTGTKKPLAISYREMSAQTVLVEFYGVGSARETLTVFHPDGATLMATHYCAQGNQPRLRLKRVSGQHWIFAFADATNLPDAKASHLVRLELELLDPNHLVRTETYRAKDKDDVVRLELQRIQ
jgi:hypothetical protein